MKQWVISPGRKNLLFEKTVLWYKPSKVQKDTRYLKVNGGYNYETFEFLGGSCHRDC